MPITNIDITDQDHETRITANEGSITTLNSSVSSLSSTVNNPTTGLSALNTTVSSHTTSIGVINTTLASHTSSINTLNTNYGTLSTTVSGHTTSIATLNSNYSTLSTTVSGHTTSISNINTSISGITTDISNIQTSLENVSLNTTGFENQTDSTYSFNESTRTFTIQPATTSYNIFQDSVKSTITTSKSIVIPDVTSPYFIFLDNTNTLQYLTSFDISLIENKVYVAVIYWNATQHKALFVGNERHEASMSWATHYYLHTYEGSRYHSGFALSGFSIDGDGTSEAHSQFVADAGVFSDEDIIHNMIASSQIPVLYRIGTEWRRKTPDNYPFIGNGQEGFTGTGRICYNQLVTGSYQLTEVSNNHHVLVHLLVTNDITHPVIAVLGINEYNPVADARAGANTEISSLNGLPFTEFVLIGTVILQTSSSYMNTYKVRTVSTDLGENYVDFRTSTVLNISSGFGDHSLLSNLDKDTHLQYLTNGRGDARYGSLTQTNTNTSDISTLNTTVSGHTTSIATLNSNYSTLSSTVSGHTTSISTLTSDLSALTGVVGGHTTSISTLTSDLSSLTTTVSGHTTSIGTINTTLSSHTTSISTLNSNYSTLSSTVSSHTTSISTLTSDLSSLTTTVSGHTTSIGTINTTLSSHTTSISTLTSDLSTLSSTVSGHTTSISTINTTLTSLDSRVTALEGSSGVPAHASTHGSAGSDPIAINTSQITAGVLPIVRGGTNISSYTTGDVLFASNTNILSKLAIDPVYGKIFASDGTNVSYKHLGSLYNLSKYQKPMIEECVGAFVTGEYGWSVSGGGSGTINGQVVSTQNNFGIYYISTGTTATGWHSMRTGELFQGLHNKYLGFCFQLPALSTATQRYTVYIGFQDNSSVTTEFTSGIVFKYSDNINSGNWQLITGNAGVKTTQNTTTPVTAGTYNFVSYQVNSTNSSVTFYLNGTQIGTPIATNLPTGSVGITLKIVSSVGTTAKLVYIDTIICTALLPNGRNGDNLA